MKAKKGDSGPKSKEKKPAGRFYWGMTIYIFKFTDSVKAKKGEGSPKSKEEKPAGLFWGMTILIFLNFRFGEDKRWGWHSEIGRGKDRQVLKN